MQFQSHFHKNGFALGLVLKQRQRVVQGRGRRREGGELGLWHGPQIEKRKITDHGYKNFVFPNHENNQGRYSF